MQTVWAICWNGPAQGTVTEVAVSDTHLQVSEHGGGVHVYRRHSWCDGKGHYIARFQWTQTLVI